MRVEKPLYLRFGGSPFHRPTPGNRQRAAGVGPSQRLLRRCAGQEKADKGGAKAVAGPRRIDNRDMKTGSMMRFSGAVLARSARTAFNYHVLNAAL